MSNRSTPLSVGAGLLALAAIGAPLAAQIPAFPGAEGYGAYASGGRGGDVYYVTNLNTSGTGSFADAIATVPAAGRTIIFAVSGYIPIPSSGLRMTLNKVTIAGQTAPGDGIGFRNGTFRISSDDIIMRHVRLRHGKNGSGGDCLNLDSASDRSILDHISMAFSTDENMSSFNSPPDNVTLQYSLNAWGLESHSCGGLWDQNKATAHHTLWAHNHTRNPKARPATLLEWVNNVTFDWDIGFIMGDSATPADWKANVIGNYFICPPGNIRSVALEKANIDRNGGRNFTIWVQDNLFDKDGDGTLNGNDYGWGIASGSYVQAPAALPNTGSRGVVADSPRLAYKKIVSKAGPLRLDANSGVPLRDEVDTILINNLISQRANHITRESDTGAANSGFGFLNSASAPLDSDRDGMPDAWEASLGWASATQDHNTLMASAGGVLTGTTYFPAGTVAGYTRLEEYLHFKASPHATLARSTAAEPTSLTVDLKRYTLGFNSLLPTFIVSGVVGGTIVQSGTGGSTVVFTPTQDLAGRARFEFTVTDSQGDTWTQSFLILLSSLGAPKDLSWVGNASAQTWNTTNTVWAKGSDSVAFSPGDNVLFDDRGINSPTISVPANVSAGTMTVDSSKPYSFSGAGAIQVSGSLTKRGSGTLALNNAGANSFLSVIHEAGTLALYQTGSAGGAKLQLEGGSLVLSAPANSTISNELNFRAPTFVSVLTQHNSTGNWTGSGDVTVETSALWTVGGSWSGYSGRLNLGSGTPRIRLNTTTNSNFGSSSLAIDLGTGAGEFMNRNGGSTAYAIGTLRGGPNTKLYGTQTGTAASTYSIGARNETATFSGSIRNGGAGGLTHVTKVGTGTWTLDGASTHTGTTTVSNGELRLLGSFSGSPIAVSSGARLTGTGSAGALVTVNSGGRFDPGTTPSEGGTFLANAGLTANSGATLAFDIAPTLEGVSDRVTVGAGTTYLAGAVSVAVGFQDYGAGISPGTYRILDGNSLLSVSGLTLTATTPAPAGTTRQTFSLVRPASGTTPATLDLVVAGAAADLVWNGADGANWDLATSASFTGGPTSVFQNLDRVTFTDGYGGTNATLAGTLQPAQVSVTGTRSYQFSGSGVLGGPMKLVKSGAGSVHLGMTAPGAFTGGVELNDGTLSVGVSTTLGTGPVRLLGGTLQLPSTSIFLPNDFVFSGTSRIASTSGNNHAIANATTNVFRSEGQAVVDISGMQAILSINGRMDGFAGAIEWGSSSCMLRLNQNSSAAADVNRGSASAHFNLGTAGGRLANRNGGGVYEVGALSGGPNTVLQGRQTGSGDSSSVYRIGALNTNTTFNGSFQHAGDLAGLGIVKVGTGQLTLGGTTDFIGSVEVEAGEIILPGSLTMTGNATVRDGAALRLSAGTLACESLSVDVGGELTGSGTVRGDLNNRGTVHCSSPGALTIEGDVVNDGVMRLSRGAELIATGGFVNNGVLDLMTAVGGLPANLINNGTVIDSSAVRVNSFSRDAGGFRLRITGHTGHVYRLQTSTDLAAGWSDLNSMNGVGGAELEFVHEPGTNGNRFYRILVDP